jgi:hypothetical protein
MKKILILFTVSFLLFSQKDEENQLEQLIVTPNALILKSKQKEDVWTVQTITRNFEIYGLKIDGSPYKTEEKDGINISYYNDTNSVSHFNRFKSGFGKEKLSLIDIDQYQLENNLGLKDKIAMITYINREKFPFIEKFFEQTLKVGSKTLKTTLKEPINVLFYRENSILIYQTTREVKAIYPQTELSFRKSDYEWYYKNKTVVFSPTSEFIKNRTISAIKSGRVWYNKNWEKMRKAGKLKAVFSSTGKKYIVKNLSKKEVNLLAWWKKN